MAPPTGTTAKVFPCPYCCMSYGSPANVARHVQASHRNENRFAVAAQIAGVARISLAETADVVGPPLLAAPAVVDDVAAVPATAGAAHRRAPEDASANDAASLLAGLFDETDDEEAPPRTGGVADRGREHTINAVADLGHAQGASDGAVISSPMEDAAAELLAALPVSAPMVRHVFATSTAARIRAYYDAMSETILSKPVVPSFWATRPSRFSTPSLRGALRFAWTAGGCGLTRRDHIAYAQTLREVEREATCGTSAVGPVSSVFASPHSFLTATRHEQNRVLALRRWMTVPIVIDGKSHVYYYRDILQAGLDALASAESVSFGGAMSVEEDLAAAHPDGWTVPDAFESRGTLDADMYVDEGRDVRRIHGADAKVMAVQLHADEALVSWSGANYIFPVRANFVNVLDGGGRWETVGYLQHLPKAVGRSAKAKLKVSDARNELLQRCLAVSLRRLVRASEDGVTATVAGHGSVLLVPRVTGLVVDQVEERSILGLMGNQCRYFCSPCMEDKRTRGGLLGVPALDRDVNATLDAQLAAAIVRAEDPRPSRRRALGDEHSALAFAPALGAMHGLSTGATNLYKIVSFDLLHFWKLGVLRLLAQRLPSVLHAIYGGGGGARLGTVQDTLEAINLRGWELGRNCKTTPAPPGCFVPSSEPQATMKGRSWRHFSVFWPFMVAGAIGPAIAAAPATLDGAPVAPTGDLPGLEANDADVSSGASSGTSSDEELSDGGDAASNASSEVDDGWREVPGDKFSVQDEPVSALPDEHLAATSAYEQHFPGMAIHDAFLETSCRAARLGGLLFGDNMANPHVTTEEQVNHMDELAKKLGADAVQTLYGHVNTSKLHRLIHHLADELRARGNLWEGDTSTNEKLHGSCKRMFKRSNKRGPKVALQMIRCDESQSAIIRELVDADEEESAGAARDGLAAGLYSASADQGGNGGIGGDGDGGDAGAGVAASLGAGLSSGSVESSVASSRETGDLPFSGRARRVAVGDLRTSAALAGLGNVLRLRDEEHVTVHNTVRIMAKFEWGARTAIQHLRATDSFFGRPWHSFARYVGVDGSHRWGRLRLVLRSVGSARRSCVVLQRMRRAAYRPGCVLTRYGCVRLAWDFSAPDDDYPALEVVDAADLLRTEDVQVDWEDLADRHGLRATLDDQVSSPTERRAARFFVNAFYPWTSRELVPGL